MAVIHLGELAITVTCKAVKHTHLSVHPPHGRVTLVAPLGTHTEVMRAYAISKLDWIRRQQAQFRQQARETPRRYITRETEWLWGKRHLLQVDYAHGKPAVTLDHLRIRLQVRPGSGRDVRTAAMQAWYRAQLHAAVPKLIAKWEPRLNVRVERYFLQRMKTKWGSCNARARHIRLNTELAKKPRPLLEYVVVHEMLHMSEPHHGERFIALLNQHYPAWRNARAELNALPLGAEPRPDRRLLTTRPSHWLIT